MSRSAPSRGRAALAVPGSSAPLTTHMDPEFGRGPRTVALPPTHPAVSRTRLSAAVPPQLTIGANVASLGSGG